MNYVVDMGLRGISSCIKNGSAIQKFNRGTHIRTHRQQGDLISLFLFFQNKGWRLKNVFGG
jgi:hypothetical protein